MPECRLSSSAPLARGHDDAPERAIRAHGTFPVETWIPFENGSSIVDAVVKSGKCQLLELAAEVDHGNMNGAYTFASCFAVRYDFATMKRAVESGKYGKTDAWITAALLMDDLKMLKGLEELGANLETWTSSGGNLLANARNQKRITVATYLESRNQASRIEPVVRNAIVPVDTVGIGLSSSHGLVTTVGLGVGYIRRVYELEPAGGYEDRWTHVDLSTMLEPQTSGDVRRGMSLRYAGNDFRVSVARLVRLWPQSTGRGLSQGAGPPGRDEARSRLIHSHGGTDPMRNT